MKNAMSKIRLNQDLRIENLLIYKFKWVLEILVVFFYMSDYDLWEHVC